MLDNVLKIYFSYYENHNLHSYELNDTLHYVSYYNKIMNHFQNVFGDRIHEIVYEELVDQPEVIMDETIKFCDLQKVSSADVQMRNEEIGMWKHYQSLLKDKLGGSTFKRLTVND